MPASPLPPTVTEALARGLSARAMLEACLERIDAREGQVRAFASLDREGALAQAERMDAGSAPRGVLGGAPIGFKDIIATEALPTEYNSPIYAGHRPVADASVVALSRAAGGIVLGKTVTCEFANRAPGPTTNPHDPARTPGGSSSGSAAAVAAGMVPLAVGTQTSGSVIRPGAFCGVHAMKPSWGEISYAGAKLTSGTLDTIGLYARSLADLALFRAVLTRTAPVQLIVSHQAAPRIGLYRGPHDAEAGPGVMAAVGAVARAAEAAGARVVDYVPPPAHARLNEAVRWISAYEGARSLAWEAIAHRDRLSPDLRDGRIRDGEACSPEFYRTQARLAERCRVEMDAVFEEHDVLLTPACPGEAPVGLRHTGSAVFNGAWTALHVPAITLPGQVGPNGLPIGVQLVGARGSDQRLLEIAAWIERAVGAA